MTGRLASDTPTTPYNESEPPCSDIILDNVAVGGAPVVTVREVLAGAERRLTGAGVSSPGYDAAELLAHVLRTSRAALATGPDRTVEATDVDRYVELVEQRADRVPLQHLTGVTGFRYLDLAVGPGVFVPRPETELLAGWAVDHAAALASLAAGPDHVRRTPIVVDLCAGSGAIALAVAHEVPAARVHAVELDPDAHAWAQRNVAARVTAGDRPIDLRHADATAAATLAELNGIVDIVVTNPPYVPDDAVVAPEVRRHDPRLAIFGGPDGLDVVRRLLDRAAALLRPGGVLGIEHADLQGEALPAVVRAHGAYAEVTDHPDLNHRPRYTTAVRR